MEDRFENFISENKTGFDIYEPPEDMWKRIERKLKSFHGPRRILLYASAAAAIFLVGFFASELLLTGDRNGTEDFSKMDAGEIAPVQLKDAEAYYTRIIDKKMQEIQPIIQSCPNLEEELQIDFTELDHIYSELKSDLRDNISSREVIKAIIENYRFRIDILEDMLIELEPDSNECLPKTEDYEI